jgi:ABC-type multidrug transport system ATPase subunit
MFKSVTFKRFKKFTDTEISLYPDHLSLIAGPNNSGKSTILHGLAIWGFCRTVVEMEQGSESLLSGNTRQGIGLSDDDFSPVAVPNLKHLWSNLKTQYKDDPNGYTLRIAAYWDSIWDENHFLEFGLSLANDRLFIKVTQTNLTELVTIPKVAYVPPFAGITGKESRMPEAVRQSLIGQGLSGAVIRNLILDMQASYDAEYQERRGDRKKIKGKDLQELREHHPWSNLQNLLQEIFSSELRVKPFNEVYHRYIDVEFVKGVHDGKRFKKYPNYSPRDIMVEGSGFLQWLSVFTLALSREVDVLLLDEPDAHLHPTLQSLLVERLKSVSADRKKQILFATHSTEILRNSEASEILAVSNNRAKYLGTEKQKTKLFVGLGSDYMPKLDKLRRSYKLCIVENEFDERLLKSFAALIGEPIPEDIVFWFWTGRHKERKHLYLQLSEEIDGLRCISLRDRDDENVNTVNADLVDKAVDVNIADFKCLKWYRRNIENYILCPRAIAAASQVGEPEVRKWLSDEYGLSVSEGFTRHDAPKALVELDGKEIFESGDKTIRKRFSVRKHDVLQAMTTEDVPIDVKTVISQIRNM